MEAQKVNHHVQSSDQGIDLNKLRIVVSRNLVWILAIFLVVNASAYLFLRYTKDLYESVAEIKLDIKDDAASLGIPTYVGADLQNADLISGEIEIIRSNLFLNRVLDSLHLEVSYFSRGEVLNHELFRNTPFEVQYNSLQPGCYNTVFNLEEIKTDQEFLLKWGNPIQQVVGKYDIPVTFNGCEFIVSKNKDFEGGGEVDFFFVVNSRDVLTHYLSKNLSVDPLNFSAKTIRVAFKDNNPEKAQAIIKMISNLYLSYSYEQKNETNRRKIQWLNNEMGEIEKQMDGYEDYFKDFTLQNKTSDLDADLRNTISAIHAIDTQRYVYTQRIADVNLLIDDIAAGRFSVSPAMHAVLPAYMQDELVELEQILIENEKLKLSYTDQTHAYRQQQQQVDIRKDKVNQTLQALKTEWLKKLQALNRQRRDLENEFVNMPDKSTQFTKNQRFYKLYEGFYLSLLQSRAGFEIALAGNTLDFKILSTASLPRQPISPNRLIITLAGVVISLVLNFFFIGILYVVNDKITSQHELERIHNVPVLGIIPASRNTSKSSLVVASHPKSMVSEAIRTIRTNLDFFKINSIRKVITISSTVSGEGKSFVAMNLGAALALSGKKVVLIDLDMRKIKVNQPGALEDFTKGISTVLIGKDRWQDCVAKTEIPLFDFIPSGINPPNPSELLLNEHFTTLMHQLRESYDFVILDTPPVGLVTDGIQAMRHSDISLYIFRANYSKRHFLKNLQRITSINQITNITSLLNAVSVTEKTYGYGYGYYEEDKKAGSKLRALFKRSV